MNQYPRVAGRFNTLAPFIVMSGNQESVSGSGPIGVDCYHSKLFSTSDAITLSLGNGLQDGQLKKLQFVHKGHEQAVINVDCPLIMGDSKAIQFINVGDYAVLAWAGGSWCVLETGNVTDPTLQTPRVV